jgi:quercetin dioxygenase-like cupin family protein
MKKAATAKKTKVQATVGASTYVRPQEMEWAPTQFDKVFMKVLYQDKAKGELTCLVKLEPGAKLPMHVHPELEQAYVLEGSMWDHDGICRAGEYVWRTAGSYHENQSDEGAIVLAIYRKLNIFQNSVGFERGRAGY